jgi:hypothetical protein
MKKIVWILISIIALLNIACQKAKVVEVNLPPSEVQTAVECYLEPGQPIKLLLSETQDSYQKQEIPSDFYSGAFITITHSGQIDTLNFNLQQDTTYSAGKVYNYSNPKIITYQEGEVFSLYVKTAKGKVVTAQTSFVNIVPIDSIFVLFNSSNASLKIDFKDNLATQNYYRITIADDTAKLNNRSKLLFTDDLITSSKVSINMPDEFNENDTLQVRLYHLDKPYYDFTKSVSDAIQANGDPFAVPSQIKSNIVGGVGIFQALSYDRKKVFVNR